MNSEDYDEETMHHHLHRYKFDLPKAELLAKSIALNKKFSPKLEPPEIDKYLKTTTVLRNEVPMLNLTWVIPEIDRIVERGEFESPQIRNLTTLSEDLFTIGRTVKYWRKRGDTITVKEVEMIPRDAYFQN